MPDLEAWEAWSPREAVERLRHVDVDWCVVGGWAIDLFLGEQTREHGDLEIEVLLQDHVTIRLALPQLDFYLPVDGAVRPIGRDAPLPADVHQTWAYEPSAARWRIDVMGVPGDARTWAYRRDPSLTAQREQMVGTTEDGIRHLRPEAVLLFKAKHQRPKDEADFATATARMDATQRAWLRDALTREHPGHDWLARLQP